MTPKQRKAIEKHGRNVQNIFRNTSKMDPVQLCRKLRRIELDAEKIGLAMCNDSTYTTDDADDDTQDVMHALSRLLGFEPGKKGSVPVFINRDPRGYALKIDSEYVKAHDLDIHRDMGGYGILAPEIDKEGR